MMTWRPWSLLFNPDCQEWKGRLICIHPKSFSPTYKIVLAALKDLLKEGGKDLQGSGNMDSFGSLPWLLPLTG